MDNAKIFECSKELVYAIIEEAKNRGEDVDPVPIIKKLTGVDLDEYISDVTYSDGTVELLDVKGKTLLIGDWKRVVNDNNR